MCEIGVDGEQELKCVRGVRTVVTTLLSDFLPDGSADGRNLMVELRRAVLAGCELLVVLGRVVVVEIFGYGLVSDSVGYG